MYKTAISALNMLRLTGKMTIPRLLAATTTGQPLPKINRSKRVMTMLGVRSTTMPGTREMTMPGIRRMTMLGRIRKTTGPTHLRKQGVSMLFNGPARKRMRTTTDGTLHRPIMVGAPRVRSQEATLADGTTTADRIGKTTDLAPHPS